MIGVLGFDSQWGLGIFLFTTASRMTLEPTQPPIQWVPGALSLGVKWPGHEADHSPPSSECMELYLHSSNVFMVWCLVKHRDNFTFTLPGHNNMMPVLIHCIVLLLYLLHVSLNFTKIGELIILMKNQYRQMDRLIQLADRVLRKEVCAFRIVKIQNSYFDSHTKDKEICLYTHLC
jgi:hypothetical protein